MKGAQVFVFLALICNCSATWKFIVNEEFKDCAEEETRAGIIGFDWEIIQEGEDVPHLNGTWTMLGDLVAPWPMNLYTMRFEQGNWVPGPLKRNIPDFCASIHSPVEVWYPMTKKFPKCPWKKGVKMKQAWFRSNCQNFYFQTVVVFDMIPLTFNGLRMTSALEGKWELFMDAKHPVDGDMKDCCIMMKGEVMDL